MTGIAKLLANIKARFEPTRPAAPTHQAEVTPISAVTVPEIAETRPPEPLNLFPEPPPAEEAPTVTGEARAPVEEAPTDGQAMPPAAASAGGLTLRLESERGSRSTFEVTKSGATLGRGPESTIQLADLSVSRKHARIAYRQGAYWLSDLGSMGGTWVDGTKLAAPRRVAAGQTIDIGVCRLTVISAGADEESSAANGPSHAAVRSGR